LQLAREVLDIAASHIRPGVTTDEIDAVVHQACIERNAYPSPLNYRHYPKSVCTSINEVICHGIPDQRKLQEGDIINIGTSRRARGDLTSSSSLQDVTLYHDGFHGDLNETYPVGKIDEDSERLIRTARKCLDESIKICRPGALIRDIGKVIEPIARANGCSSVRTYTGHGINNLFHCTPNVPHYAKNKTVGTMKAGMVRDYDVRQKMRTIDRLRSALLSSRLETGLLQRGHVV
jgi:methionyl aminopeptidase